MSNKISGNRGNNFETNMNSVNANYNLDSRYEDLVVNEDDRAEGSKPADFFHTEYMRQRNLIHWKKVQNVIGTNEINSLKHHNKDDKLYQNSQYLD